MDTPAGPISAAHDVFRHLVETSPFGVYAVDADFRLVQVSAGAQKVFRNVRPLLGRDFAEVLREIWPEPFASEAIGLFRHTLATGEPYHAPRTVEQRRDVAEVEAYDWKIERVTLPDGRPGVVCHFYDLSERQRYERKLEASEQRFRAVFERAATGISINTTDGVFVQVNPAFAAMVGYAEDELRHLPFISLVHPDDREGNLALFRSLAAGEIPSYEIENRLVRKDGGAILVHRFVSILQADEDAPVRLMALVTDVTARRRAEAALRQADRMDAVGRLAGGVAHEANNQMTVVLGSADFALRESNVPPAVAAELRAIRAAALRTAAITGQLLAFGRRQMLRTGPLDLNEIVGTLGPTLEHILGPSCHLDLVLCPSLSPIVGDRGQLEQVLVNLAFNARDAMAKSGLVTMETGEAVITRPETGSEATEPLLPGRYAVLTVRDTGEGMSADVMARIFEPFFTTRPIGQGTGLGLSTVYGIVRQMGGDVLVESAPGAGATFRLYLPLAATAAT